MTTMVEIPLEEYIKMNTLLAHLSSRLAKLEERRLVDLFQMNTHLRRDDFFSSSIESSI